MADSHKIHALRVEVARLRQEQLAATDSATYLGSTPEERAVYDERATASRNFFASWKFLTRYLCKEAVHTELSAGH